MAGELGLWSTVLGLTGLLMLAVLMLPAARRLDFPYTVLLAAVGVFIGLLDLLTVSAELPVIGDFFAALRGIEITAEAVFFIFLAARERAAYDHQFEDGFLPSATYRILGEQLDDLTDALRMGGPEAYGRAAERSLRFGRDFHVAMTLQRRFGITAPLARAVADRFARLSGARLALAEVVADGLAKVRELVGAEAGEALQQRLQQRREATEAALESLERQYPDYARRIERRLLQQGAFRLEEQSYRRMHADGLISGEVFGDLLQRLRDQERELEHLPKLDLGLDPRRLVAQVPLFQDLAEERIDELAALLEPRLVLPGERVVARGEQGDAMYFVSNGALRVDLDDGPIVLGSGDFFGELALMTHQPRNADVIATGFADLLLLRTVDFQHFMAGNPDTREKIEAVARERLGIDERK
ncbi:MAG: cyclic nucleotide-binding domain-containing protein [Gammaproteobacteria bacterium]|nr:cyclic nucleotide-binding domain-containing protein [Gammaproteobacteria bacterium]